MIKQPNALWSRFQKSTESLLPISLTEKLFFTQNLAIMLKAGMALSTSLKTLALQTQNRRFKTILTTIAHDVEGGKTLGESVKKYPKVFSEFFVNMVKSGEVSGKLEEILAELHEQLKQEHALLGKVRGALTYPVFVIVVMIVIAFVMMIKVVPQIVTIFQEVNAELPLATRVLIATSSFMTHHLLLLSVGSFLALFLIVRFIATEGGKLFLSRLFLRLPIFGSIVRKVNIARFARTMSALLKTDIPIHESFRITANILSNRLYRVFLQKGADDVKRGVSLQSIFEEGKHLFPPMLVQIVAVGEETGTLDDILAKLATFYEDEVNDVMEQLPKLIEPLLLVILGLGVAAMAIAIIMPMYSLTQSM